MKKSLAFTLFLLFFLLININVSADFNQNIEFERVLHSANEEYKENYGFPSDFYNNNYPVSQKIYDEYNILVCTINGITEHGNKDNNGEFRYLGYDPYGESIENPNYYYDALDGRNFDEFNWLNTPWYNKLILEKYNIKRSQFDKFAPQFREIFLYGFNYYHGENGIFGNHLGPNWQELPWETYYHIPIAPTEKTRGVAWLFHKEKDGSIWYTSAWLPPLSVLENEVPVIVDLETSDGNAVIGHNKLNASTYDTKQSVPTKENLYVHVTTDQYRVTLNIDKISGSHAYRETKIVGYDAKGNPIHRTTTHYIPYRYYKIGHLEVYGIDHAIISNYALPNGRVTLYPNASNYQLPKVEFNTLGGKTAINSHVTVWNDSLMIDGQVILDSTKMSQYGIEPKEIKIPLTQEKALYQENFLITPTLANKAATVSSTQVYYKYIAGTGSGIDTKVKNVTTNRVTVHAPTFCDGGILSDHGFDQSLKVDASRAAVILGRPSKIQITTEGQHKNTLGYGYKEYAKYTSAKQVKIPFDVYMGTTFQEEGKFLKANTWYSIPLNQKTIDIYVPTWVHEGNYTLEYRSLAINVEDHTGAQKNANLDLNHYIATDSSSVKVIGRLYGFEITDVEHYPLWESVFRSNKGSWIHSSNYYKVGTLDKDGKALGIQPIFTLPLLKGSHPTVNNEGTLPSGYTFKFKCQTIGNYETDKDCIEITPSFYYVSEDGKKKQEIDVYYSEYFNQKNNYFVKIGSELDKENVKYIKLGDPDRNVTEAEIKETSRIIGITETAMKTQSAKLGWYNRVILAKPLRTFVGDTRKTPDQVNPTEIKHSVQNWYGEYSLPNHLYIAPKGYDVISYSRTHNGLNGNESFWLKNGYVVVNFDIVTIKNGDFDQPVLSYYQSPRSNMWDIEGYQNTKKDYKNYIFNVKDGDIVFYETHHKASDDYDAKGTH